MSKFLFSFKHRKTNSNVGAISGLTVSENLSRDDIIILKFGVWNNIESLHLYSEELKTLAAELTLLGNFLPKLIFRETLPQHFNYSKE